MFKMSEITIRVFGWRLLLLFCVGLFFTACDLSNDEGFVEQDGGISATSTAVLSGADAQEDSSGSGDLGRMQCPANDSAVPVEYVHMLKMNLPAGNLDVYGETDVTFYLTIRGNGVIESEDYDNRTTLQISGKFDDCTIEGEADLTAEFEGTCVDGLIDLFIVEQLHNVLTVSTCPGKEPQKVEFEGLFSAPEDHFKFELKDSTYTHVIQVDTQMEDIYYHWVFQFGAEVVPLVP